MNGSSKPKYYCSACSLSAICLADPFNTISCITVCPNCSGVSVPVVVDDPKKPTVRYVPLQGVNRDCADAIMCGGYTTDLDYRCPRCGFKKGKSPRFQAAGRIARERFMRRVSRKRSVRGEGEP